MNSLERRLGHLEKMARDAVINEALRRIGERLGAGDQAMAAAVEQAVSAATEAEGLVALDVVLGLLDQEARDPAVKEHLKGMIDGVRAMNDDELLTLARKGVVEEMTPAQKLWFWSADDQYSALCAEVAELYRTGPDSPPETS